MKQVWLITGASRGLGLEMARAVLKAGHQVVATARRPAEIEKALGGYGGQMLAAQMDVTQPESVDAAVASAIERFGRIDVLVNNAGYGQLGWFEAISDAQTRRQFETNVFGAMQVTRAVLPTMRRQRSGHVITISSVAGLIAVAGASIYAASKFAVEGWMEALAQSSSRWASPRRSSSQASFVRTSWMPPRSATATSRSRSTRSRLRPSRNSTTT